MSDLVLRTHGLGKMYHIGGERQSYRTLRESMVNAVKRPIERIRHPGAVTHTSDILWALRELDVEVHQGEVLGIIGRNGSGKSTFLKILSRITEPTEGRVEIRGRVGSLLEVGTGFHSELTGRENIMLNGAILGMTHAEIKRKFDEIVEFSEIGRFLDTPVKRYSSGMYVRLAFAVAAHLEPDILLVDEVLAVGDANFQQKCIGKMEAAAGGGRTVFFVSHNMAAVLGLCTRVILLDEGRVVMDGVPNEVAAFYHTSTSNIVNALDLATVRDRRGDGRARIVGFTIAPTPLCTGSAAEFTYRLERGEAWCSPVDVDVQISIRTEHGLPLFQLFSRHMGRSFTVDEQGVTVTCRVPRLPLIPGRYRADLVLNVGSRPLDWLVDCMLIEVTPGELVDGVFVSSRTRYPVVVASDWTEERSVDPSPGGPVALSE
jgi:lipopolysaccharide transport system ATP-binding protein